MRLDEACDPTFARHETFHPRFGWFRKAFLAAARNEGAFFLSDDAPVRLGVGKNMVRAIRFWGAAAHLVAEVPDPDQPRVTRTAPTNYSVAWLGPDGLDPYMEESATWWWLHWMMLAPGCQLPVWWVLFHQLNVVEFDDDLAIRASLDAINSSPFDAPHPSSVTKDVTAFIHTYAGSSTRRAKFDDQFGCPLRGLRLVTTSGDRHRLATDPSEDLPGEVVLAAVLDYLAMSGSSAHTVSLARLATEPGSPARVFRLNEEQLAVKLGSGRKAAGRDVSLSAPVGALQLAWRGDTAELAHQLLCAYFDVNPSVPRVAGREAREPCSLDAELEFLLANQGRGVVL